jgi:DNA polymerase (family 10)
MHDDVLDRLDWVVGSVHQSMRMDPTKMTERLLAAIGTCKLNAIGHPTGRKIGKRDPYKFNFGAVLDACEEHRVALEINASPSRMDLRAEHVEEVLERPSLWITINTDAHSIRELNNAQHGVRMAQRAGVPAERVINCLALEDFLVETQDRA